MSDQTRFGGGASDPFAGTTFDQPTGDAFGGDIPGGGSQDRADSALGQATQGVGQAVGAAKQQASEALDTTKEKAGQVADQATAAADTGIDKAAMGLDRAADLLRDQGDKLGGGGAAPTAVARAADGLDRAAVYLRDKDSAQLTADLEALVRRKPTESLLAALGIGFILSKIVR